MISLVTQQLQQVAAPYKQKLTHHPLYTAIQNKQHIVTFMQHHVWAVWDFMSLLKSLQQNLTCVQVPWKPVGNANTRFFINEIVLGEECDVDFHGVRKSHFEMYLDAMHQANANTNDILQFVSLLQNQTVIDALQVSNAPSCVKQFVAQTFQIIQQPKHVQAAVFTYGREDLIPHMFIACIQHLPNEQKQQLNYFKYYLERHIEVDGDHHSLLAIQMTEELCGQNKEYIEEAKNAVEEALASRLLLWDGIYEAITQAAVLA